MSLHQKPTISVTYGRKIRQPRTSNSIRSSYDELISLRDIELKSSTMDNNNQSNRLRTRQSMKDLTAGGSSLGKRSNFTDEVTDSYSKLSVSDKDNSPPTKKRSKIEKKTLYNFDVFDFPKEGDDEIVSEFQRKASFKNSQSERQGPEVKAFDMEVFDFPESDDEIFNRINVKSLHKKKKNNPEFRKTTDKKSEQTKVFHLSETFNLELRRGPPVTHKSGNTKSEDKKKDFSPVRNYEAMSDNMDRSDFSEDADTFLRGSNDKKVKQSDRPKSSESFNVSDYDDILKSQERTLRKKSSRSFTPSGSPKTTTKSKTSSIHLNGQNLTTKVRTVENRSSSSMQFSRFLTRKTSKSIVNDETHPVDSSDKEMSVDSDDVFDLAKYVKEQKGQKSGSHEPIIGIVSNLTNNISNADVSYLKTRKKVFQSSKHGHFDQIKTPVKKSEDIKYTDETPQGMSPKSSTPGTPNSSRSVSEVGTPISFLSFHQKKQGDSVWDAVDAVASPIDMSYSPRKQNLVARMSKPSTPSKSERNSFFSRSLPLGDLKTKLDFSPSSSQDRKEDSCLSSYEEDLLASTSSSSFDYSSSPPLSSYNLANGSPGVQKTYGQGRTILGQDLDSFLSNTYDTTFRLQFDEDQDDMVIEKSKLRSLHELREVGSLNRFTDEIDYILDGLRESQPLGYFDLKFNSGIDLARKLLNGEFLLKVRAHNYISRIYKRLSIHQDSFIRYCFAFIICLLIEDRHSSELLIKESGFMEIIVYCLNSPLDPFSDDNDSLKRSERLLISLKSIALRTLSSLTSLRTRYENFIKNNLKSSGSLDSVMNFLKNELESVPGALSALENGKSTGISIPVLDFERVEQCLKILEYAVLFCTENQLYAVEKGNEILQLLLEFLLYCQIESCNSYSVNASSAMECLLGSLRVLINLTNDNQQCCQYVGCHSGMSILMRLATIGQLPPEKHTTVNVDSDVMREDELHRLKAIEAVKFDVLSHVIVLLINLAEMDPNNHDEFCKVEQNPHCLGSYKCLRKCTCSSRESAVSCLVSLYNYQLEKGNDETDNMLAAYIAVLLGLLIKNNRANQSSIIDILFFSRMFVRLPNRSVSSLINLIQLFVHFNELIIGEDASANGPSPLVADQGQINHTTSQSHGRTIGESFLEIIDILKSLES
ncbi:14452_t:CDS:10 [Acaulospora morrowiae]|uniref:14452_t:CDS:1 n=1 Tax=Acaulospora morrowiae TaxID=94023 RepID=A0A9N8VC27_9GLOM|nr:14452_t:CDS:10 [Acaulospora morrowiae]